MKKLLSLKSQLIHEIKHTNKSSSGDGADDIKISEWDHWDALQFLVPTVTPGKSVDSIQILDNSQGNDAQTPKKCSRKSPDSKSGVKTTPISEKEIASH